MDTLDKTFQEKNPKPTNKLNSKVNFKLNSRGNETFIRLEASKEKLCLQ